MKDKKLLFFSIIALILLILVIYVYSEKSTFESGENLLEIDQVMEIKINGKKLSDDYLPYLESINKARVVSYDRKDFDQLGLAINERDHIELILNDGNICNVYSGYTGDKGRTIFISINNTGITYEANTDFLNIINAKPYSGMDYPVMDYIELGSIIAVQVISSRINLVFTEDVDNQWMDQVSGENLNRLKVQNYLNKIINLRAVKEGNNIFNDNNSILIRIETINGLTITINFIEVDSNYFCVIGENGFIGRIEKAKVGFLFNSLSDFQ